MSISIQRRCIEEPPSSELTHLPDELKRVLWARGVVDDEAIDYSIKHIPRPDGMLGLDKAVSRLVTALKNQEKIIVVGDFDADGATSTAVAVRVLRSIGGKNIDFCVPNRFTCGYGLTPKIVSLIKDDNPDLIVTVDNGIASIDGVAAANELGIDVIVTDHHLPGDELPAACAIVNPNQEGDHFTSRCLAGVGVIFYVMSALRAALKKEDWFTKQGIEEPNLAHVLDIVAVGSVADVVPLDRTNRLLIEAGLRRIRAGLACVGINALLSLGKKDVDRIVAQDLGFQVGPRLNAAGRLDDMRVGIQLLITDDPDEAQELTEKLDNLNKERKGIETDMAQRAMVIVDEMMFDDALPRGLCLYDPSWHQGVVGLVASRVKEVLHRPVIAFAQDDDGSLKGSARSVPGVHIRDVLSVVALRRPDILSQFGGHAMAAGMRLKAEHFDEFAEEFAKAVSDVLAEEDCHGVILTDGPLPESCMTLSFAEQVRALGPWGQSFPEPVFEAEFVLIESRWVAGCHLKMVLQPIGSKRFIHAIWFRADWPYEYTSQSSLVTVAFRVDENCYRSRRSLQLIVLGMVEAD